MSNDSDDEATAPPRRPQRPVLTRPPGPPRAGTIGPSLVPRIDSAPPTPVRGPDRRIPEAELSFGGQDRRELERRSPAPPREHNPQDAFWPEQPHTLEESGLSTSMVEELILKAVFFAGELRGRDIASRTQLPSAIVEECIEGLKKQKYLDIKGGGASGMGRSSTVFQLTSFATDLLRQILDRNRYNGPAPVKLEEWTAAVKRQTIRGNRITHAKMQKHFKNLVIRDYIFDGVGPAMNSGRSIFFYGSPGNGKTVICQAMTNCFEGDIFIPHAILIDDFIIRVFDNIVHRAIPDGPDTPPYDHRWVRCRRPLVVVGGELTLEMLDLVYSPEVRYYEASFQMKASNGMLLIDDFGRQRVAPKDLLNRWIVPLESDIDFLTLHTGKKVQVPFDVFTAFSTNLNPAELVDDAFLRRVRYKLEVKRPDEEQFHEIWNLVCRKRGIAYNADAVQYLIDKHYTPVKRPFAACQPRDLLEQIVDLAHYAQRQPKLERDLIDAAVHGYFVKFR